MSLPRTSASGFFGPEWIFQQIWCGRLSSSLLFVVCCLSFVVRCSSSSFVVCLCYSFSFVFVVVIIVIIVVVADVVIDVVVAFVFDVNNDYGKV